MNYESDFVTTKEACKILGVTPTTLRTWDKKGKISAIRTPTNIRRYNRKDIYRIIGRCYDNEEKKRLLYCRVSSKKQVDDLARQKDFLQQKFPDHSLVTDIGSGLNWKRRGLRRILECAMSGNLEEVVVAHKDRLCRFAYELIEWIIISNGGRIIVLNKDDEASKEQELAEDILSIVHVFSCRQMGCRRYKNEKDKNLSNDKTEEGS